MDLTEKQKANLIHNLGLGLNNVRFENELVVAEWIGVKNPFNSVEWNPTVYLNPKDIGKDLFDNQYSYGDWVQHEVIDLDWFKKGEKV